MSEIEQAIQWFENNCCNAYEDDGSVYIEVEYKNDTYFAIQVSSAEISYRAELYKEENEND